MPNSSKSTSQAPLVLATLVAALGGFLFGYDTAVVNGAIQFLKIHFALDSAQEGLAGASAILGCIPGAMAAGFLSDRFGRKKMLFLCAILYAGSALLSAMPSTFSEFLMARFLSGLAIGASSMICPIYIAELSPEKWRGRLGSLFQLGIVLGIFITLFINLEIQSQGDTAWNADHGWRLMLGAEAGPALILLALLFFVPESPRWFIQAGREAEGRAVLTRSYGAAYATAEINAVNKSLQGSEGGFKELFAPSTRRPLILAVALMAFQQLSGINAVIYYSTKIFSTAGQGTDGSFTSSVWIGLVNTLFTFVAIYFVDKAGRKPLLLIGTAVQAIALAVVGWIFASGNTGTGLLVSLITFIGAFAMAMGPVPWILCSEIFPTRIRGRAMAVATFSAWVMCYVVAQTFPMLHDSPLIGPAKTFWLYGIFSLASFFFVAKIVPETKGQSLESIEASWRRT